MKLARFVTIALIASFTIYPTPVQANIRPVVESFLATPDQIELTSISTRIDFELIVSHPAGIETIQTQVSIRNNRNDSINATLTRTDSPIQAGLQKVIFKGSVDLPRQLVTGIYSYSASPVKNNMSAGYQYDTGVISGTNRRDLPGAENGILIRYLGDLNLSYETFVGPTYDSSLSFSYVNSSKYGSQKAPIWRVGETVLIDDYFEKRIPGLDLKLISNTPSVCATDGLKLVLIAQGNCNYVVFAPKTNNYIAREYKGISLVESARTKPTLFVQQIPNQVATGLPKNIEVPAVYATSSGYLVPLSQTPNVCVANLFTIRILSGGTCTLTYQAPETSLYKATDVYVQTFEITRTAQTLDFVPLNSVALSAKTLTLLATASSGLPASFSAEPTSNCMVSGNTLSLLKPGPCNVTAQQVGTATIAPVSKSVTITITGKAAPIKRTISCVKGSKTVKVTKVNPKCPKGYSRVR